MVDVCFFKILVLYFHTGSLKINIFKVLFLVGRVGVRKMSTLCMLLIMLTILDDPLVVAICK